MAHPEQFDFVKSVRDRFPNHFASVRVLEVGSLDINGSIRQFFTDCEYTGVDLGPGAGVDQIAAGETLDYPDHTFDTTASCECFEHNEHWQETFANMWRMTRSGGLVFFTCATTGRKEHGTRRTNPTSSPYAQDYYRNLTANDFGVLPLDEWFSDHQFTVESRHHDLCFWGVRR